jgi:hypothetical protein
MKKIKVRFNLGRGKNYMKWKIEGPLGTEYHSPADVQLVLHNCQLKNNRKTAEKIFNGENKDVCAWVLCDSITIKHDNFDKVWVKDKLSYNPRKQPYWVWNNWDVDNKRIAEIVTIDNGMYAIVEGSLKDKYKLI